MKTWGILEMNYKPSIFVTLAQLVLIAVMMPVAGLMFYDSFATQHFVHAQESKPVVQEKAKTPALTAEQKLTVRSAQVRLLQAQNQAQQIQQQLNLAQQGMQQTIDSIYAAVRVSPAEYAICDGPSPGPCAAAPVGDLTLQPIPPPAKEKK